MYCTIAPDSNMVKSPSLMAGTLPTGLSRRHSGLDRYSGEKLIGTTWCGRPSSAQSQTTRTERVPGTW